MEKLALLLQTAHNVKTLMGNSLSSENVQSTLSELSLILKDDEIKDNKVKVNALKLMYELDKEFCKEVLIDYTQYKNPSLRRASCGMLSFYPPDKKASEALEKTLRFDPDIEVRLASVFSLSKVGLLSAVPTLEWAKENDTEENWENRSVRDYADVAIDAIKLRNM